MNKLKFYKYAAWGMLVLNIAMLAFFFFTKPRPPRGMGGMEKRAIDILNMDRQQHDTFLQYAQKHSQQMRAYNDRQRTLLQSYFNSLVDRDSNFSRDTILAEVQQLERQKIESTYLHFQEVKSILRPKQLNHFEEFVNSALQKILLSPKKNPRPPRDF